MSRNHRHGKRTHLQYNGFIKESPILQSRNHLSKAVDETSIKNHHTERNFGKRTETSFHLNEESDDSLDQADGNHATPLSTNTESNTSKPPVEEEKGGKLILFYYRFLRKHCAYGILLLSQRQIKKFLLLIQGST